MTAPDTIGVMFTRVSDGEFPTVADIERSSWSLDLYAVDTEPFADWLAIAFDPRSLRYGDDDREAMDETNWDAIVAALVDRDGDPIAERDVPKVYSAYRNVSDGTKTRRIWDLAWVTEGADEAIAVGVAVIGSLLAVAPDNEDAVEAMRECSRALADYPLLDEDAYSEREYEAWQEYTPQAWSDEIRDAVNPYPRWNPDTGQRERVAGWLDEDTAEALEDADADAILAVLSQDLHYWTGLGDVDYSPAFLELFAARFADLVTVVAR
jgi:hypothetical protein